MRIKIKISDTTAVHQNLFIFGVLSLLALAAIGEAVWFAGDVTEAWQAAGRFINDFCQDDLTCRFGFVFIFKIVPFLCFGIFGLSLYEKLTKFRTPAARNRSSGPRPPKASRPRFHPAAHNRISFYAALNRQTFFI